MSPASQSPGVLLLGNHAPPYGGVPNHVGHLARHLASRGWRVHVMSDTSFRRGSHKVGDYWVHAPTPRQKIENLVRTAPALPAVRAARHRASDAKSYLADVARSQLALRLVRQHGLDLISSYHVLKPGISAAWVSEQTGVPLVTTLFGEVFDNPELHQSRVADVRYIFQQSDTLLSCSRHCASSPRSVLGLSDDVGVLYYGVDTQRHRPFSTEESLAARDSLGVRADDRVVLYVARMVEEMGLGDLLAAVPDLLAREPHTRVLVAGAAGSLTPRAHALAAQLPDSRMSVHESVPDDVLPQLYAAADVVAAPSNNDRACLGLTIAEAMATERPVVACAVGGTAEVVVDGETGTLVPPNAPEALALALLTYLKDAILAARHGAAGRSRAMAMFDVEATNARVEELFLAVMARHGRRFAHV